MLDKTPPAFSQHLVTTEFSPIVNVMDREYLAVMRHFVENQNNTENRTDMTATCAYGHMYRIPFEAGHPCVTSKKLFNRRWIEELIWFFSASENIDYLVDKGNKIWNDWADAAGRVGPMYGAKWRKHPAFKLSNNDQMTTALIERDGWTYLATSSSGEVVLYKEIDQLQEALDDLKHSSSSRRIIVDAWDPATLPKKGLSPQEQPALGNGALACCHSFFQFHSEVMTPLARVNYWAACVVMHFEIAYVSLDEARHRARDFIHRHVCDKGFWVEHTNRDIVESRQYIGAYPQESAQYMPEDIHEILDGFEMPSGFGDYLPRKKVHLQMYQRSADWAVGVPFNTASYAGLRDLAARTTNHASGDLIHMFGNLHMYSKHLEGATTQLTQEVHRLPILTLPTLPSIDDYREEHFDLHKYEHSAPIKFPIAE